MKRRGTFMFNFNFLACHSQYSVFVLNDYHKKTYMVRLLFLKRTYFLVGLVGLLFFVENL